MRDRHLLQMTTKIARNLKFANTLSRRPRRSRMPSASDASFPLFALPGGNKGNVPIVLSGRDVHLADILPERGKLLAQSVHFLPADSQELAVRDADDCVIQHALAEEAIRADVAGRFKHAVSLSLGPRDFAELLRIAASSDVA